MPEWWTYGAEDFLLFSPRAYWRMIERHNEALWPLPIAALLIGAALPVLLLRRHPWSGRAVAGVLAAAWGWVAWSFLWQRYAAINWAAAYAAPVFALQGLLLVWFGVVRNRLRRPDGWSLDGIAGLALCLYALALHPFVAVLAGRPLHAAEVFGIAPDPTAIGTLGLVLMAGHGGAGLLLPVPVAWCLVSGATLHAMEAPEAWVPFAAAGLAVLVRLPGVRTRTASPG